MTSQRSLFEPTPCINDEASLDGWTSMILCPANFPPEIFEIAILGLVNHPEYNSTLILRSEVISDWSAVEDFPPSIPQLPSKKLVQCIHRKLLPRRPRRDASLEQYCSFYGNSANEEETTPTMVDTLLLTPIVEPGSPLPYYHPAVSHLAFQYIASESPKLLIEVKPLPGTPTDLDSRLYRTCLALLETLHRYGWGAMTNYKKRVVHDCLVEREVYQDLYLVMRERHKHLVDTWKEVTDPLKHVFEDIGIATFLMLLWKDSYSSDTSLLAPEDAAEPWKAWPRPPGGFLDFGCGNGLLTHILVSEGYEGYGLDLRARTSWEHYPEATREKLQVHAFDPTVYPEPPSDEVSIPHAKYLPPGAFIIANHADELSPWVSLLATLHSSSGYLSIPCCSWALDAKFERGMIHSTLYPIPIPSTITKDGSEVDFVESLNLGGGDGSAGSSYSMYRIWLAALSLHCGWEVESETLRIPSTRNWGLVGRKRRSEITQSEALENVHRLLEIVKTRAVFKARRPEGKAGDH